MRLCILLGLVAACVGQGESPAEGVVEDLTITVKADQSRIQEEENTLRDRRLGIEGDRKRLEQQRLEVTDSLARLSKKDKQQRQILEDQQLKLLEEQGRLTDQMLTIEKQREGIAEQKNDLLNRISVLAKGGARQSGEVDRELLQSLQETRKLLEKRSAPDQTIQTIQAIHTQLQGLAKSQAEMAEKLQSVAALLEETKRELVRGQTSAPAVATPANTGALKKKEKQLEQALAKKGILTDDLTIDQRQLYDAAQAALAAKDSATAEDLYGQLIAKIDQADITMAFLDEKARRIGKLVRDPKDPRVAALNQAIADAIDNQRLHTANQKLNEMYELLRGAKR